MEAPKEKQEISEGAESAYSELSKTKKYIAFFVVCYCTFAYGCGFTFLGPTVTDFSNKFGYDSTEEVTRGFSILTGSYLVGALSNGILNRFLNRQVFTCALLGVGSAALFSFPHVGTLGLYYMLAVFLGIFAGGYDSAQIAWVIDIWRHEAPPFILTQHFAYSVGTVIPPLMLSPFLTNSDEEDEDATTKFTTTTTTTTEMTGSTEEVEIEKSQMWIPFSVAAIILGSTIIAQILFYFLVFRSASGKYEAKKKLEEKETQIVKNNKADPGNTTVGGVKKKFEFPPKRQIILTLLSCFCMAFYQALELGTMQFLPTFAHNSSVRLTESASADVLFGLTIAFCVFRGIGIIVVLKVPPHFIFYGNLVLLVVSNIILLVLGDNSKTWMWVGSVLMGVAMSTTFPSYFAYIEKYLFISDTVAAIILVVGGGISSMYPIIVGGAVDTNPKMMIYVNFVCCAMIFFCFTTTFWLTYFKGKKEENEHLGITHGSSRNSVGNANVTAVNNNNEKSEVEKF